MRATSLTATGPANRVFRTAPRRGRDRQDPAHHSPELKSTNWTKRRGPVTEDSFVALTWYQGSGNGFVDGSAAMALGGVPSRHRLSPPVVRIHTRSSSTAIAERTVATVPAHSAEWRWEVRSGSHSAPQDASSSRSRPAASAIADE